LLTLLPTPIGNIEDITLRALRVLEEADIILCEDTRIAKRLLQIFSERYNLRHNIKRFISLHSHNEYETINSLDRSFFEQNVVYMSDAGMPCISDPGALLVNYCLENGIEYSVLPGPSAFVTAYAGSGFLDREFLFFGFLPHKGREREEKLQRVLNENYPVILYESPHRLEKLLNELAQNVPDRLIVAVKEITKKFENYFKGTAVQLKEQIKGTLLKGEWVIIVSPKKRDRQLSSITINDIESLDIPPKQRAKLLSKLTGKSVKECYLQLSIKN
jgi:16S rRNA (cytidine1402-2'-O)-methyltransferase